MVAKSVSFLWISGAGDGLKNSRFSLRGFERGKSAGLKRTKKLTLFATVRRAVDGRKIKRARRVVAPWNLSPVEAA
jgi:hypothetical protein